MSNVSILSLLTAAAAAYFAWSQVKVAKESSERELKAYVIVDNSEVTDLDTGVPKISYRIQNVGQTPVYKMTQQLYIDVHPYPLPEDFQPTWSRGTTTAYFGKSITISDIETKGWPESDIAAVKLAQNVRLYVMGIVHYRDIFQNDRMTEFCFMYLGEPTKKFGYCHNRNNAN